MYIYIYMYMCEGVVYIQYICVYRYRPFTYFFPTFPSVVMLFKFDRFNASVVVRAYPRNNHLDPIRSIHVCMHACIYSQSCIYVYMYI